MNTISIITTIHTARLGMYAARLGMYAAQLSMYAYAKKCH